MAYITGSGSLTPEVLAAGGAGGYRSKEITGSGDLTPDDSVTGAPLGLAFADGEILSYTNDLQPEPLECSGAGKADSMYGIPRTLIDAEFKIGNTLLDARFKVGGRY